MNGISPTENLSDLPLVEPTPNSSTLFVKDVGKIDCALFDPSLGIIGQSWHVDVWLTGALDENGFVFDFSPLKSLIKQTLASTLDHSLIIPVQSQSVQYNESEAGERWVLRSKARGEAKETKWEYLCPKGSVFPVHSVSLKTGVIEAEFARILRHRLPQTVLGLAVKLREEPISTTEASYRYTHGIQGHNGLCQRLFHGHRSRIEVYVAEERRPDLEHFIAREIFSSNIHIATINQIKSGVGEIGRRGSNDAPVVLNYAGTLGIYEAILPSNRLFFVEFDTSIEAIAKELAKVIKREEKTNEVVKVIAYEGIDKGAIGTA
ncbi:MAG: 6-carboxytetrahydropterin synthase [Proteobacteria bacterium]|nr:6-carboxytetrahydropterin synthase [Pseudomonadota bacterium]